MMQQLQAIYEILKAYPPLTLLLIGSPFLLLAYFCDVFPTRRTIALLAIPFVFSLGLLAKRDALPLVFVADIVIVAAAIWDVWSLPRQSAFSVSREMSRIGSLHKPQPVALTIVNQSKRDYVIAVRDGLPESCTTETTFDRMELAAKNRATLRFDIDCRRRGALRLEETFVKATSRYGLWQRFMRYPVENDLNVYPDMQQLSKYAMLARTNRLSLMGVRRHRRIGQDNEFERLRDFSRDDQYKHIDWRSTARRHKLTVRDFQTNQSQRIIFLVDCGRMMVNESSGLSLLDHALNSMLMLSYVALRQGDSVGMLAFSDAIHAYVPPGGGMQQMNRLLHGSFDRFPRLVESRYDEAFLHLSNKCRKRSLVILITNVIDEVNASQVESYLGSAGTRHLPLCVLLRDPRLFAAADRPLTPVSSVLASGEPDSAAVLGGGAMAASGPESDYAQLPQGGLYAAAAASSILTWRHQVLTQLQHRGVLVLDAFPEDITAPLLNQYLDIKARHLL